MNEKWQTVLQQRRLDLTTVLNATELREDEFTEIKNRFPIKVSSHISDAPVEITHPVWKQFLPGREELDNTGEPDPLKENRFQKAPLVIHRYPNRVLFLVSTICASYCRFCTRKRMVGRKSNPSWEEIEKGLAYIGAHPEIDEVILSGGDPLLLSDEKLEKILKTLRKFNHVQILRISTRTFLTLPERITKNLISLMKKYQPVYVITQFNHPDEISGKNEQALASFIDNGIPILNQSVLLKGVNDDRQTMLQLIKKLTVRRIRPYYLHHLDPVTGTSHFEVPIETGLDIIQFLRENAGGHVIPQYVYDNPEAKAKTLLYPNGK